jgi:hypothetical protein
MVMCCSRTAIDLTSSTHSPIKHLSYDAQSDERTSTFALYKAEGKHDGRGFLEAQYPEGPVALYEMLEQWRKKGERRVLSLSNWSGRVPR